MDGNRVDLGNVKGDTGVRGVSITRVVELPPDENNLKRNFRIELSDNSSFEYSLTEIGFINRLNQLSVGSPNTDYFDVPTIYLLKNELNQRPKNTEVYRQEIVYTKNETDAKIEEYLTNFDLFEVVSSLPTGNNIKDNVLYILTKNNDSSDSLNQNFDLYIYTDNEWKKLDNLTFNIANYYTSSTVDGLLNNKQDISNISNNLSADASSTTKYPSVQSIKHYVDSKAISDFANYYTKTEVDALIGNIQQFIHS